MVPKPVSDHRFELRSSVSWLPLTELSVKYTQKLPYDTGMVPTFAEIPKERTSTIPCAGMVGRSKILNPQETEDLS